MVHVCAQVFTYSAEEAAAAQAEYHRIRRRKLQAEADALAAERDLLEARRVAAEKETATIDGSSPPAHGGGSGVGGGVGGGAPPSAMQTMTRTRDMDRAIASFHPMKVLELASN